MLNNRVYVSKEWNNARYRREVHTVNWSVQQDTVHIPHGALLAVKNKHIFDSMDLPVLANDPVSLAVCCLPAGFE